jgi:hypothetical protein
MNERTKEALSMFITSFVKPAFPEATETAELLTENSFSECWSNTLLLVVLITELFRGYFI